MHNEQLQQEPQDDTDIDHHSTTYQVNNLKLLKEIRRFGCTKDYLTASTYRTYLDLIEVRKYHSASFHFLPDLDIMYLKAKQKPGESEKIIVPISGAKSFSFREMETLQRAFDSTEVNLAICDPGSTVSYYKLKKS